MRHWPDTLPTPIGPGYGLEAVDQYLRTDMEVGPARTRRLTRARRDRVQAVWVMTPAEFVAFRAWFEDGAWSLAGHSDDLAHWAATGAGFVPAQSLTPSLVPAGRLVEDGSTGAHLLALALPGLPAGVEVRATLSLRAAGRARVRAGLLGTDAVLRDLAVHLGTGAGSGASGVTFWSVTDRGNGWWRVSFRVTTGAGAGVAALRVSLCDDSGAASYVGTGVSGADLAEVNLRLHTGADLYLPTDAAGAARGAAGGPAWAMIPVWTGGPVTPVECRFEQTFTVEVKPGLNTHVSAPLEVRHA